MRGSRSLKSDRRLEQATGLFLGKNRPVHGFELVGVGVAEPYFVRSASGPDLTYLQAQNQLRTFASMTGGKAYFPRFEGEMPEIFRDINSAIRNQYVVSYRPTNAKEDGTYRRIRVELVDNEGKPLQMQDEKHHSLKYDVVARDGYRARQEVE